MIHQAQFDLQSITDFSSGSLANCFGENYRIYEHRQVPRTPNGDLMLISRVLNVEGTPGDFKAKNRITSEYDVPANPWYIDQNGTPEIPYSILTEIALQPCGFLATYLECPMIYKEEDLCFRNLDAKAELVEKLDLRGKTITSSAKLTSLSASGNTIIVNFEFRLKSCRETFFFGNTVFGYFPTKALKIQLGIDQGVKKAPWFKENKIPLIHAIYIDLLKDRDSEKYLKSSNTQPYYKSGNNQLNFLDQLLVYPEKGDYKLGYIYGLKNNDPTSWFYPCHFFGDPVMPGSLGLEAMLQTVRVFALEQGLGKQFESPYFTNLLNRTTWKYRGQIVPEDKLMTLEMHIKIVERRKERVNIIGDGSLWKDGLRIYEVADLGVSIMDLNNSKS